MTRDNEARDALAKSLMTTSQIETSYKLNAIMSGLMGINSISFVEVCTRRMNEAGFSNIVACVEGPIHKCDVSHDGEWYVCEITTGDMVTA